MKRRGGLFGELGYASLLVGCLAAGVALWHAATHADADAVPRQLSAALHSQLQTALLSDSEPGASLPILHLPRAAEPPSPPDLRFDEVSARAQSARGLYYSGMRVHYLGASRMVRELRRAGLNAAVVDLKDGEGKVTYPTRIELLQPQVELFIQDPAGLTSALRRGGVHSIARIVCFTDPSLPRREPARAVMDGRPGHEGEPWANWKGRNTWLDPYNGANHDLIVALAMEAETLGFDEIQLDYFRFPVDEAAEFAHYPAADARARHEVLAGLLARIDAAVAIPLGVDVFGTTAFRFRKPGGLGQRLEAFAPHVEVLSPMLYLKGMQSLIPRDRDRRAERAIRLGISNLRKRLGEGLVLRPFLQAFRDGSDYYTPDFIAEQVRGVARGRGDGYLFWHPNSDYDMVTEGQRGPIRMMAPFPSGRRRLSRALSLLTERSLPLAAP